MPGKTKVAVYTLLLTATCFFAPTTSADSVSVKGGPAIVNGSPSGATKYFGVRGETDLGISLMALEAGAFGDNTGNGQHSSLVGKAQLGINPGQRVGLFGKAFLGPCVISTPDTLLGGRFPQFATDVGVGFRDKDTFMVFGYSHISSAGVVRPNKGRDFLTFEAGVQF